MVARSSQAVHNITAALLVPALTSFLAGFGFQTGSGFS